MPKKKNKKKSVEPKAQPKEYTQEEFNKVITEIRDRKFNPFKSNLRYFNAETDYTAFRDQLFTPTLNWIGKRLNFMSAADCESISKGERKFLPMLKMALSTPGAAIRLSAKAIDIGITAVLSPIDTIRNIGQIGKNHRIHTPKNPFPDNNNPPKNGQLKTVSLNTALLHRAFWKFNPTQGDLRPPEERVKDLIESLKNDKADVICLQEVFDPKMQAEIVKAFGDKYYIAHSVGTRRFPCISSGLMTISKYPIVESDYQRFPNLYGEDTLSNKGFISTKIKIGGEEMSICNTHTQASGAAGGTLQPLKDLVDATYKIFGWKKISPKERRDKEFDLILESMLKKENPSLGYQLCGDMNQELLDDGKTHLLFKHMKHKNPDNLVRVASDKIISQVEKIEMESRGDYAATVVAKDELQKDLVKKFTLENPKMAQKMLKKLEKTQKKSKESAEQGKKKNTKSIDAIASTLGDETHVKIQNVKNEAGQFFSDHNKLVATVKLPKFQNVDLSDNTPAKPRSFAEKLKDKAKGSSSKTR